MSIPNIAQGPNVALAQGKKAPAENKETWFGRTLFEAKRTDHIRYCAIAGAIITGLGLLLLSFMPVLGSLALGLGVFLGLKAVIISSRENHLEKALIHLIGSKEKIEQLPEVKRDASKGDCLRIKKEDMTANIMRVTHNGKTHGVAFKWYKHDYKEGRVISKTNVALYLYKEPFNTSSGSLNGCGQNYEFRAKRDMRADEGSLFQEMIRLNWFGGSPAITVNR